MSAVTSPPPTASDPAPGPPVTTSSWAGGWLIGARGCPSPNFNARPIGTAPDLVVLHSISLPPGRFGGSAIEELFLNRLDWDADPYYDEIRGIEVSAHFLIRRTGELVQFVSCDERAWHAGLSAWRGRGPCNDYSIGIELEGLEGSTFDASQYEALARLLRAVGTRYPIAAVAGHEHVAPGRKRDPGPGFDWERLVASTAWPRSRFSDVFASDGNPD